MNALKMSLRLVAILFGMSWLAVAYTLTRNYSFNHTFMENLGYMWPMIAMIVLGILLVGIGLNLWSISLNAKTKSL